ncbi:MAG: hypothetical protein DWQ02_11860 [Bacteroidetes bacterium]|nr:MAG: hypothetical protein DWQ02_11860 [Bacteroidota bacterium]
MKTNLFIIIALFLFFGCDEESVPPTSWRAEAYEFYERGEISFFLSDQNYSYQYTYSICDIPSHAYLSLSYGGPSGYHLVTGVDIHQFAPEEIPHLGVKLVARGEEELFSSTIETQEIVELYQKFPERVFVDFFLEIDGEYYSNIVYQTIPFEILFKDENAQSEFNFREDFWVLQCMDNHAVLPIEFEYDGYLYSHDADSIQVSDFKAKFVALKSY